MTTIKVDCIAMPQKTISFDKPFANITASEIMSRLNCSITGWTEIAE